LLRTAINDALRNLLDNAAVKAIVFYGEGRFFSAGADIKDFARSTEKPTLPDVLKSINNSPKPVIIITTGRHVSGAEAVELNILTRIQDGTALDVGIAAAKEVLAGSITATPTDELTIAADDNAVEAARRKLANKLNAPLRAIDAIESSEDAYFWQVPQLLRDMAKSGQSFSDLNNAAVL